MSYQITRKDAIKLGDRHYSTGKACCNGHTSLRYVSTGHCVSCRGSGLIRGLRELSPLQRRKRDILRAVKSQAKRRGIEFSIGIDDVEWNEKCPILGIDLVYFPKDGKRFNCVSLDRRDSTIGYVKNNVAAISMKANSFKSDTTIKQIELLLQYMKA